MFSCKTLRQKSKSRGTCVSPEEALPEKTLVLRRSKQQFHGSRCPILGIARTTSDLPRPFEHQRRTQRLLVRWLRTIKKDENRKKRRKIS